jgi:hypothetical protein
MMLFLTNARAFQQKQSDVVAGDRENGQHSRTAAAVFPLQKL